MAHETHTRRKEEDSIQEFYNEVFLFAASFLFFLQRCLLGLYHRALHDPSILLENL